MPTGDGGAVFGASPRIKEGNADYMLRIIRRLGTDVTMIKCSTRKGELRRSKPAKDDVVSLR